MSKFRTYPMFGNLVLFLATVGMAHAGTINLMEGSITVTDVVTQMGPLYQYNYTVADGTTQLAVLDIAVTPGVSISNLSAPGGSSGFTATVDTVGSGSGEQEFVSFLENNAVFTAAPESGFIFDSTVAPRASTFGVTLFDGTAGTQSGITAPVATPEPASLLLCALGGAALLLYHRKARLSRNR